MYHLKGWRHWSRFVRRRAERRRYIDHRAARRDMQLSIHDAHGECLLYCWIEDGVGEVLTKTGYADHAFLYVGHKKYRRAPIDMLNLDSQRFTAGQRIHFPTLRVTGNILEPESEWPLLY